MQSLLEVPRASFAMLERDALLSLERFSSLELSGLLGGRGAWPVVVVTDDGELWMIGGIWPVDPGDTVYVGGGGPDSRIEAAQTPVPQGTVKRLRFGADIAPGSGQSFAYTLFKNGLATSCAFTVTGATRKGGSDVEVACSDGDELCVRVVVSAGAQRANHSGSIQFAPAA